MTRREFLLLLFGAFFRWWTRIFGVKSGCTYAFKVTKLRVLTQPLFDFDTEMFSTGGVQFKFFRDPIRLRNDRTQRNGVFISRRAPAIVGVQTGASQSVVGSGRPRLYVRRCGINCRGPPVCLRLAAKR